MDKLQFNLQTWNNDSSPALSAENLNYVNSAINTNLRAINELIDITDDLDERIDTLALEDIKDTSSNVVIGTTTPGSLPSKGNYHLLRTLVVARSGFSSDYPNDFIPLRGEICIIYPTAPSTQLSIKVGDGSTNWENLPLFKGERGFKGDTGYSPKITVLRTDTEDYGEAANVDATTADNGDVSLTFKIPAGPFTKLNIGSVNTLDPTSTAHVTISDVEDHPEQKNLNFGIPQGYKGDKGAAATITVGTVTALPAGSTPVVQNRGTDTAAIFDFKIPQGPQGEEGPQGEQGIQGEQGLQGDPGISISSVTQTTTSSESGGDNIITCTLSNGNQSTFTIKNGAKGDPGSDATIVWQTF